jgi:hypothetical protein
MPSHSNVAPHVAKPLHYAVDSNAPTPKPTATIVVHAITNAPPTNNAQTANAFV